MALKSTKTESGNTYRVCKDCKTILLLNGENFHQNGRGGFRGNCRKCHNKHCSNIKKGIRKEKPKTKICSCCYNKLPLTEEYFYKQTHKKNGKSYTSFRNYCIKCHIEKSNKYIASEAGKASQRKYAQSEKGQIVISSANFRCNSKRRAKIEAVGEITSQQWKEIYDYWQWKCAYSKEVLRKENRSLDHIVALGDDGTNYIWNVIPMNKALNRSKGKKNVVQWLKSKDLYSEELINDIKEYQIHMFNKYGKEGDELILITEL